jgi:hypothetical protein
MLAAALSAPPAHAEEVWMVKSSGVHACKDREALVALDAVPPKQTGRPEGCVELYSGERLLGQADVGAGFNDYMKVQRGDGSLVFVRGSALVPDPGIGSVTDDRRD